MPPGTATEQFCIGGLLYNEETHACDWPQNVAGCQKHREWNILLYPNIELHSHRKSMQNTLGP